MATPMMPSGAVRMVKTMSLKLRSWNIRSVMIRKTMTGMGLTRKPTDLLLSSSVPASSMEQPSGRLARNSFVAS